MALCSVFSVKCRCNNYQVLDSFDEPVDLGGLS